MYKLFTITMLWYALLIATTGKESLKEESQKKYTSDAVTLILPLTKCNPTMEQDNSPSSSRLLAPLGA